MIDLREALSIAEGHFPHGPETLAKFLGVDVRSRRLAGCDGWCIRRGSVAIIQVNASASLFRQRFTLAHELAHLILGSKPRVRPLGSEFLFINSDEERAANQIAAEMLLPESHLRSVVTSVPADATVLRRLAKRARVSEVMAACRLATLAKELGLLNAAVVGFQDDKKKWVWSNTLNVPESAAATIYAEAKASAPATVRRKKGTDEIIVAFLLDNPSFTSTLFLQILPAELGGRKAPGEEVRELGDWLFGSDFSFRGSVNGCLSSFRNKVGDTHTAHEALAAFNGKYLCRWTGAHGARLRDPRGQRYLLLRLTEWFPQ